MDIDIQSVVDKIHRLQVKLPAIEWPSTVYLIDVGRGVLVEPGPTAAVPAIQEAMKQLGMRELEYIIPTHIHLDHAGGMGSLAQLFPQAKVLLHPKAVRHVVDPSRLIESTRMSFGDDFEAYYGVFLAVPEAQVKAVEDGETFSINGRTLQIIHTPGHAPHHIAVFDRETGSLFCGEALGLPVQGDESSPRPAAAPPAFDMDVYLESMEKLRRLNPRILCYSHVGVGREPDKLIGEAAENTRRWGDIVMHALKQGEDTAGIERLLREEIHSHLGVTVDKIESPTLEGFIFYFKKNGLV
ncbi:MBL fold metallo-hydrolase [Chloroflexota bacterium]